VTRQQQFLAARAAYVAVVLIATLTQLDFTLDFAAAADRLARAFTPTLRWGDAVDALRNLTLFAGLGAVWVVTSFTGKVGREVRLATLVGFGLSVTAEGFQVFSPIRTASLVDVTTNTIGAFGGALVVAFLIVEVVRAKAARSYLGMPAFLPAGAYALAVLCEAATPLFRSEPQPGISGPILDRVLLGLRLATPLAWDQVPLLDAVLFTPAGFLVVMMLAERGRSARRTWLWVAGAGAVLALAAEAAHGILSLSVRWEAAAIRALTVALGAWAAQHWLPALTQRLRGPARARAAIMCYGALLVVWGWRPFVPQIDRSAIAAQLTSAHLIPLASLASRADVFSALHVVQQFALYFPLGGMLVVWPLRLGGRWSGLGPALLLAVAIETGHLVIAGRFFDVTNALVAWAGLGIGWTVVRRSGFRPHRAALGFSAPGGRR
jgi:glycopeptide antibiotics resistance protein